MKILVLHSRLSGYWMACMRAFVEQYNGSFFVVRKKVSSNAPFEFGDEKGIQLFDFSSFTERELTTLCKQKEPDLVYVSGWSENIYLKISRHFYKKGVPVICGLDNHWFGNMRQLAGKLYHKYFTPNTFSQLWIPGLYQFEYARQLGFKKENIKTGVYSANVEAFSAANSKNREEPYPKSFLFVGRFIERKGLLELAESFHQLKSETDTEWTLTLIGNGPLKDKLKKYSNIKVKDFVQPEELPGVMSRYGVFILPSIVEPWGVVIHEAAAAGMPIISTYDCGATTAFIRNGYNGYLVRSGSVGSLRDSFDKLLMLSDQELYEMGKRSSELSKQYTPYTWASTLKELIADRY